MDMQIWKEKIGRELCQEYNVHNDKKKGSQLQSNIFDQLANVVIKC